VAAEQRRIELENWHGHWSAARSWPHGSCSGKPMPGRCPCGQA